MKDICLIDVDSKIPNLALMKLSTFHKEQGDRVKLGYDPLLDRPDLAYASKIFDFTPEPAYLPECEVIKGGTGYDIYAKLDIPDYERIMPDYSLYPDFNYAMGRFTRGCPNRCPWCVVPKMDGNDVRQVAHLKDFWGGVQSVVRVLDDNIMADEDIFCRSCEELSKAGVKAIWEALDIRLINDTTAAALASVKHEKSIHFAWDSHAQDDAVPRGLEILRRHGMKGWRFIFYVLIGYGTTMEYDLYRINTLRELGTNPYVMPFDKHDRRQMDLARWCNNKFIFKKCLRFEDYDCPTNRERK